MNIKLFESKYTEESAKQPNLLEYRHNHLSIKDYFCQNKIQTMSRRFRMKIRAGETFLYRKEGTESQVFEIRMKSEVDRTHAHISSGG